MQQQEEQQQYIDKYTDPFSNPEISSTKEVSYEPVENERNDETPEKILSDADTKVINRLGNERIDFSYIDNDAGTQLLNNNKPFSELSIEDKLSKIKSEIIEVSDNSIHDNLKEKFDGYQKYDEEHIANLTIVNSILGKIVKIPLDPGKTSNNNSDCKYLISEILRGAHTVFDFINADKELCTELARLYNKDKNKKSPSSHYLEKKMISEGIIQVSWDIVLEVNSEMKNARFPDRRFDTGPLGAVLVGFFWNHEKNPRIWFQLEKSGIADLKSFFSHTFDYIEYKFTNRNIGPYGNSIHTDRRPIYMDKDGIHCKETDKILNGIRYSSKKEPASEGSSCTIF